MEEGKRIPSDEGRRQKHKRTGGKYRKKDIGWERIKTQGKKRKKKKGGSRNVRDLLWRIIIMNQQEYGGG